MVIVNEVMTYLYTFENIDTVINCLAQNMSSPFINPKMLIGHLSYLKESYANSSNTLMKDKFFYHTLKLDNITIHIHFNIKVATNLIKQYPIRKIEFNRLTPSNAIDLNASVYYVEQDKRELQPHHFYLQDPVILIRYPVNEKIPYIVIDGNHRITAKKLTTQTINGVCIDPLQHHDIFFNEFDFAFYQTMRYLQDCLILNNPLIQKKLLF